MSLFGLEEVCASAWGNIPGKADSRRCHLILEAVTLLEVSRKLGVEITMQHTFCLWASAVVISHHGDFYLVCA
jgi:hypothetical protein